jgi:LmbE family N-acetylglucosaminyl deacetylase
MTDPAAQLTNLERVLQARRILVIGAHPDDPDAFAAGTVALWTEQGATVRYIVVTSGDKGIPDDAEEPAAWTAMREQEQRDSARSLGVEAVDFLGYTDGEVFDSLELRGRLVRAIRAFRPDLVVSHDPFSTSFRWHPDHRAVGFATQAAVFPSCRLASFHREHLAEGLQPHSVHMMLATGATEPNLWIDIATTFPRKIAALELHVSQAGAFAGGLEYRMRRRAQDAGARGGLELAEEFRFEWLD